MNLFPIGTVSDTTSGGSIGLFFEPNVKANGVFIRNIQTAVMKDITINTYKKQEPFRRITYEYKDIFDSEFSKINKFSQTVEGGLNSFHVVDLSAGEYVGSVESPYSISLTNPFYYSTISSVGAYYAFAWNGVNFMIGSVDSSSSSGIDLTHTNGETSVARATIYPIYEVYVNQGDFDSFTTTIFHKSIGVSEENVEHGWLRDGTINFTSKYPTR